MNDNEFDEKVKLYFEKEDTIEPDKDVLTNIKQRINNQSQDKKHKFKLNNLSKALLASFCVLVIVVISILVPVLNKNKNGDVYYTDSDVERVSLSYDFVVDFINQNYKRYNFIFDEYNLTDGFGLYLKNKELLAISLEFENKELSIKNFKFDLIINKRFTYSKDSEFRQEADVYYYEDFTLYRIESDDFYTTSVNALFEFSNYNLYCVFSLFDEEFFNKFL